MLEQLQEDVRGRLGAVLPAGVSVLLQREGALEQEILEQLGTLNASAGRIGLAVLVRMPSLALAQPPDGAGRGLARSFPGAGGDAAEAWMDVAGPQLVAHLEVDVWENRLLNAQGGVDALPTAESLAMQVLGALHRFRPGAESGGMWLAGERPLEPLSTKKSSHVGYRVRLNTQVGWPLDRRVARPEISVTGAPGGPWEVQVTCATVGATIFYTLDGSFPWAGNGAAAVFTGGGELEVPAVGAGQAPRVRLAAYGSGLLGSDVAEARLG